MLHDLNKTTEQGDRQEDHAIVLSGPLACRDQWRSLHRDRDQEQSHCEKVDKARGMRNDLWWRAATVVVLCVLEWFDVRTVRGCDLIGREG